MSSTSYREVKPQPDLEPDIQTIEAGGPPTFGAWHRHRWGAWGDTFSERSSGLAGAINGFSSGPWWQERVCVRCGRAQRARVEVESDR